HAEMTFVRRATSGSAHMTLTGDQLEGQRERFRLGAVKRRTQDHPSSSSPEVTLSAYLTCPARVRTILIDSVTSDHTLNGAATTSRSRGGPPMSTPSHAVAEARLASLFRVRSRLVRLAAALAVFVVFLPVELPAATFAVEFKPPAPPRIGQG